MKDCADAFYGDTGTELRTSGHGNLTQRLRDGGENGKGINYSESIRPSVPFPLGSHAFSSIFVLVKYASLG